MVIVVAFALVHALGWRGDTKIISGTGSPTDVAGQIAAAVFETTNATLELVAIERGRTSF